jgi:L-fuconolactonase
LKRRQFLRSAVAATLAAPCLDSLAATVAVSDSATNTPAPSRVVDTHTHFYDPTRPEGVPWPGKNTSLYRKVMPEDWRAVAGPHGVRETIVVEASPWVEDNQWVLDLAAEDHSILGLVGNLDPRDPQFNENLNRFAKNPLFLGLRWRTDLVPIDRDVDTLIAAAKRLVDLDLELDLNGPCQALPLANRLAEAAPSLRIVINHLGASGDPQAIHPQWRANVVDIAQRPNVFMKVSALPEQVRGEPGKAPTNVEYYLPVLDHLWDCFGEDRLLYGSNWPVSDRGAPYDVIYKIVSEYFADKGPQASEKYFWKNSSVAYRWHERA